VKLKLGKSTLMKEIKDGIEQGGKKLITFSPFVDASRGVLREKDLKKSIPSKSYWITTRSKINS
jgi:hypothetical protein